MVNFFPNVKAVLGILATLPVSTATAERSFSTLKRIKTYLWNSMGHSRLSGLALLSIHTFIRYSLDLACLSFLNITVYLLVSSLDVDRVY